MADVAATSVFNTLGRTSVRGLCFYIYIDIDSLTYQKKKFWLLCMWVASSFRFQPCLWHDAIMHSYGISKENFLFDGLASLVLHKFQTCL